MGYPTPLRSMNAELSEGATDGKYKKVIYDRGGVVDKTTAASRRDLADVYYGIHEAAIKEMPDGLVGPTPNYVPTPPARLW